MRRETVIHHNQDRKSRTYSLTERVLNNPVVGLAFSVDLGSLLNMGAALLLGAGAVKTGLRAIKKVQPQDYGVIETMGKFTGDTGPGFKITDPTRTIQRIHTVSGQSVSGEYEGAGRGFLRDGTQLDADVLVTFQVSGPRGARDVVQKIAKGPHVDLRDKTNPVIAEFDKKIGSIADAVTTKVTPILEDVTALEDQDKIEVYYRALHNGIQKSVDRLFKFDRPTQDALDIATREGRRAEMDRGIVITTVQLLKPSISDEVRDALQDRAATPHRIASQVGLRDVLKRDYPTYLNAQTAERVAESGAPTVIGLGVNTAGLGNLAAAERMAHRRKPTNGGKSRTAQAEERIKKHTG